MGEAEHPIEGLDPNLERRLDAMAREQLAQAEEQAADLAARSRTLVDVAWAAVQAGKTVTIKSGPAEHAGLAIYARGDLLSVRSRFGIIEVNLTAIDALVVSPDSSGQGRAVPREAESFAARLALVALDREVVELTMRQSGRRIEGSVATVARDHVVLQTGQGEMYIRLEAVAWMLRRTEAS